MGKNMMNMPGKPKIRGEAGMKKAPRNAGVIGKSGPADMAGAFNERKDGKGTKANTRGSKVGGETKADMAGAQMGHPTDKNALHGAVQGLQAEHPIHYADEGARNKINPKRHMPLHGMRPTKGDGY